jgi:hypothetical protein
MTAPLCHDRGSHHPMLWLVAALSCVAIALAWPAAGVAHADDSLVLSAADFSMLHLHPMSETVAAARAQLSTRLVAGQRRIVQRATAQTSAAAGHGRAWRSDAFLLGSARTATRLMSGWRHAHRAGAVKVGAGGAAFAQRSRHRQTVQVLWREGSRLGLIVLTTGRAANNARAVALSYVGDDNGAGGTTTSLSLPTASSVAFDGSVLDTSRGLVLAANFAASAKDPTDSALWATVLPQP